MREANVQVASEKPSDLYVEQGDSNEKLGHVSTNISWTPEEEKTLVRKIDWHVFPMLCIVFAMSLLDRTNISAAYIAGLAEDLELTAGARYNLALLVFFIGYGLFELPSNYVIRRVGARWWLSFLIIAWGAMVLGMGFIHTWQALTVLRAFLGVFEAGLFPGAVFIIGSWYKQYETARRVSMFYMAAMFASGFGPIIAYGLSLISVGDGMYAAGWRWIFIIEGIITIAIGFLAVFFIGDFPEDARWLSEKQREIALTRVHVDQSSRAKYEHATARQILRMLVDWKLGVYCILYFIAASSVYSLAFFFPIILRQGMGFSYAKAQLLSSPPYVFAVFASLGMAWISDRIRIRWIIMCTQAVMAIIGLLIILYVPTPGVRYFGMFLAVWGTQANVPSTLAYGQNQTPQIAKRGVVSAAMISVGAIGGVCGSTIFRSQDAPRYFPGMWATIGMQFLYIGLTTTMSFFFKARNKKADQDESLQLEATKDFRYAP